MEIQGGSSCVILQSTDSAAGCAIGCAIGGNVGDASGGAVQFWGPLNLSGLAWRKMKHRGFAESGTVITARAGGCWQPRGCMRRAVRALGPVGSKDSNN